MTLMKELSRKVRQSLRANAGYYKRHPTPKAEREQLTVKPVPMLVEPMAALGHEARPRTLRGPASGVRRRRLRAARVRTARSQRLRNRRLA